MFRAYKSMLAHLKKKKKEQLRMRMFLSLSYVLVYFYTYLLSFTVHINNDKQLNGHFLSSKIFPPLDLSIIFNLRLLCHTPRTKASTKKSMCVHTSISSSFLLDLLKLCVLPRTHSVIHAFASRILGRSHLK